MKSQEKNTEKRRNKYAGDVLKKGYASQTLHGEGKALYDSDRPWFIWAVVPHYGVDDVH